MSQLNSQESQDTPANPPAPQNGKSAAASRILRAVEMGRPQAVKPAGDVPEAATTVGAPQQADVAQDSLRSLSTATAGTAEKREADQTPASSPTSTPRLSATRAGLAAAAAKMATDSA